MFPSQLPKPRHPAASAIPSLRWAIIGPGWIAERFVKSLKELSRQRVVAVSSRTQQKADDFAARWGIPQAYAQVDEMLARPDIDAVYVATPHNHHFPDGLRVLQAGKHVLIEKPFALNRREGAALKAEAMKQGTLAMEAMWCDYAPKYDVIRQLLEDGVLGDLHTLLADHGEFFTPDHRIFNADLAGGPMMDLGSYLTSFCVMVGGVPQDIIARGRPAQRGVNGQISMLFNWENGLQGLLNTTLFTRRAARWWPGAMRPLPSTGSSTRRGILPSPPARAGRCCAGRSRATATTSCFIRPNILPGAWGKGLRTRRSARWPGCWKT